MVAANRFDCVRAGIARWRSAWSAAILVVLSLATVSRAEPLPVPAAEQEKIKQAIRGGVSYLKNTQGGEGTWAAKDGSHRIGYAALPGLTLLECGVSASDSVVQRAAAHVRASYAKMDNTYELALSILFLDRLDALNERLIDSLTAESVDRKISEILTLRLMAGQTANGGWTYSCPVLTAPQHRQLLYALQQPKPKLASLSPFVRKLAVLQDPDKLMGRDPADKKAPSKKEASKKEAAMAQKPAAEPASDNSNTHFAILALWAAQRSGVPVERSVRLAARRFRVSQKRDGGWGYAYSKDGGVDGSSPTMTCAGLLGLAIEHGFAHTAKVPGMPSATVEAAQVISAGTLPPPACFVLAVKAAEPEMIKHSDPFMTKGFEALSKYIGTPVGRMKDIAQGNLYFLWAVERVAMLYDLPTLGGKDWYRWGAEMLVANQQPDGNWDKGGYPNPKPVIDTCFALLFLKKVNLAEDLKEKLRVDPKALAEAGKMKAAPSIPASPAPPSPKSVAPGKTPAPPIAQQPSPSKVEPSKVTKSPSPPPAVASSSQNEEQPATSRRWLWIALVPVAVLLLAGSAVLLIMSRRHGGREEPVETARRTKKKSGVGRGNGPRREKTEEAQVRKKSTRSRPPG